MFEIEHFKIFRKGFCYKNENHEVFWDWDYILQIGDSIIPCNPSFKLNESYLKEYDIVLSTSSLSVLIAWLSKQFEYDVKCESESNLYEFIYHYFYGLFCNFFKDVIHKMQLDIDELEKL